MSESFIVKFKNSVSEGVIKNAKEGIEAAGGKVTWRTEELSQPGKIGHDYNLTFKGFSAQVPKDYVNSLETHADVESMEKDQTMHTT